MSEEPDLEALVRQAAALLELELTPEMRAGTVLNLERTAAHARAVLAFDLDDWPDPAPVFRP